MIVAASVVVAGHQAARAQTGGCPDGGVSGATVDIASPRSGDEVRGVVTVRGKVSAPLTVSRVELLVGRQLVDSKVFAAVPSAEFTLTWDATHASVGRTTLRVVACGQGLGGLLVQGSSTVSVDVAAPQAPPQSTVPPSIPSAPTSSSTTTTTRPSSTTTSSSVPSSSTTSTSIAPPGVTTTQTLSRPTAEVLAAPSGRLLPGRSETNHRPKPLWVGVVLGVCGAGGLVLAKVLRRRPGAS